MQPKSKLAAGLLAFFLGFAGVHNFYMGYTAKGILQAALYAFVLIMIPFCLIPYLGLVFFICQLCCSLGVWIWSVVEGICILAKPDFCDVRGIPLKW